MRTAGGKTTRRRRRRSSRRSQEDDEFDGTGDIGNEDFGIDDFSEEEFTGDGEYLLGDFMGDAIELLDFGDIADLGEAVIDT